MFISTGTEAQRYKGTKGAAGMFIFAAMAALIGWTVPCLAVTSKITRHAAAADMLKGKTDKTVIGSQGTISLARAHEVLVDKFECSAAVDPNITEPWAVNTVVVSAGDVYVGTSPNGYIYRYGMGKVARIFPPLDAAGSQVANRHIYAMAIDISGRLLAGVSGQSCELLRFEKDRFKRIFSTDDDKYIFSIVVHQFGDIYLGTGPEGRLYRMGPQGQDPRVIYDTREKNLLSLAFWSSPDTALYMGTDDRGLVYRFDPESVLGSVMYDSDRPEITALLPALDVMYAACTTAEAPRETASEKPAPAGRPEIEEGESSEKPDGTVELKIANAGADDQQGPPPMLKAILERSRQAAGRSVSPPTPEPGNGSCVYGLTPEGFATEVFSHPAVIYALGLDGAALLVGTGNEGKLFAVDLPSEDTSVLYKDPAASQITALAVAGGNIYMGTSNPAGLVKIGGALAMEGTYTSDLIDASGPAVWGKLQMDAEIPPGCRVTASARSGNVNDPNDPAFGSWTGPVDLNGPAQLDIPPGRFCQYRLTLYGADGRSSPMIREVALASTVPNLAPRVESVQVSRMEDKTGFFRIAYTTSDANGDKLIYSVDFRKVSQQKWINIDKHIESDGIEWDGKTVEDGRYEVRITADDRRSNNPATALTHSRISDPVVVDNTPPVIIARRIETAGRRVSLQLDVSDRLSVISSVAWTVDSNSKWQGAVPEDLVYDTTDESFLVIAEDIEPGVHIIAVKASDDVGNTAYVSFEVKVE